MVVFLLLRSFGGEDCSPLVFLLYIDLFVGCRDSFCPERFVLMSLISLGEGGLTIF